jgi:hypothetical protein
MRHLMLLHGLFHGHYSAPVELPLQPYVVHAWRDLERIPESYMYCVVSPSCCGYVAAAAIAASLNRKKGFHLYRRSREKTLSKELRI